MLSYLYRFAIYFAGIIVISYGISLTIGANLGVLPWDVFHLGLAKQTPLTTGMAMILTGVLLVGTTVVLTKSIPKIGTILNMIFVGVFVDLFFNLNLVPSPDEPMFQYIILLLGILVLCFGSGMYIAPNLGAGPRDGLNLVLAYKTGASIRLVKTILEVSALGVGYWLDGPVGIGTVITSVAIGPVFQSSVYLWQNWIKILVPTQEVGQHQKV
ncbi:MAG: hypothetical protein GX318_03555 [Clostridia bacterium]|nr:hypothetical protein [Clostridia bacterium]